MRVGILTFFNAHNYGAVLQAYALKRVIASMGHDVSIINYRNNMIEAHYPRILDKGSVYSQSEWNKQYERFENFITCYLVDGDRRVTSVNSIKDEFDCFVVGSDQVWEPRITDGLDPFYILNFSTNAIKISYAASKSANLLSDEQKERLFNSIRVFDGISVRESSLQIWLKRNGISAELVADPSLLLHSEQYDELLCERLEKKRNKYVLVYYVSENERLDRVARRVSDSLGIGIVEIHYYNYETHGNDQLADCGPLEFIELFKGAEFVITNSYHGVIFSIIYHKLFYAVYPHDSRKDGLLRLLNLESRHLWDDNIVKQEDIDYESVDKILNSFRYDSMRYLERTIGRGDIE